MRPYLPGSWLILANLVCWLPVLISQGQETPSVIVPDRARTTLTQLPTAPTIPQSAAPTAPLTAPKLAAEKEYGEQIVLNRKANWEPWTFSADAEYYYTDNAALASAGELEDWYLRTGTTARYTNRISGNWFMNAALDAHAILHDQFTILDFLLVKADAAVLYRATWLADTYFSAGYTGYWITQSDLQTEAFRNHALTLGAQKAWKISRGMQIVTGLSAEYSLLAQPTAPQRHEYAGYIGYQLKLTDKLTLSTSYRAGWYDYPQIDRQDWNHVIAASANYQVTTWAKLSLTASQAFNQSNYDFFSYQNRVAGLSLTLHLSF